MILLNVRGYFDPLRAIFQGGVREGFIPPANEQLITIVDDPRRDSDSPEALEWNWGTAAMTAIENWEPIMQNSNYDWSVRKPEEEEGGGAYKSI